MPLHLHFIICKAVASCGHGGCWQSRVLRSFAKRLKTFFAQNEKRPCIFEDCHEIMIIVNLHWVFCCLRVFWVGTQTQMKPIGSMDYSYKYSLKMILFFEWIALCCFISLYVQISWCRHSYMPLKNKHLKAPIKCSLIIDCYKLIDVNGHPGTYWE